MRENGIKIIRTRKYKVTTDSTNAFNIAPNLLDQDFSAPLVHVNMHCRAVNERQGKLLSLSWFAKGKPRQGAGRAMDNSMVETFFKSLKAELIWRNRWETRRQAEGAIFQYINGFYNPRRRHSSPGWESPLCI